MKNKKKEGENPPNSADKHLAIGDVFTPLKWGEFAVNELDIYSKWINGAKIFDPTMGEGNLLESLITFGLKQGHRVKDMPVKNLHGNELNTHHFNRAIEKFKSAYAVDMRRNFINEDFLNLEESKYDIVFGNPPWQNFVDLPATYKEKIKPHFFKYDLVGNSQNLLLGGSRIDIAALIIQRAIKDFLKDDGEAIFFMPLSLLLNDGANRNFRTYSIDDIKYSVEKVFDFNNEDVFGGVTTRYGLTHFRRNKETGFPIPYGRLEKSQWIEYKARPVFQPTDPLSILSDRDSGSFQNFEPILLKKESTPRQGVNTCGANDIFFFDECREVDEQLCSLSNKVRKNVVLPKSVVFPLVSTKEFKSADRECSRWVLLPYNKNGKVLNYKQMEEYPELLNYLNKNKKRLKSRKGVMLNSVLKRGNWWALLGVGDYSFFPYKIIWEAYGRMKFRPEIFEGDWQANQSLQAFIPVRTLKDARRVLKKLRDKRIETYLLSLKMGGTMNWAQPGKIKKFVRFEE